MKFKNSQNADGYDTEDITTEEEAAEIKTYTMMEEKKISPVFVQGVDVSWCTSPFVRSTALSSKIPALCDWKAPTIPQPSLTFITPSPPVASSPTSPSPIASPLEEKEKEAEETTQFQCSVESQEHLIHDTVQQFEKICLQIATLHCVVANTEIANATFHFHKNRIEKLTIPPPNCCTLTLAQLCLREATSVFEGLSCLWPDTKLLFDFKFELKVKPEPLTQILDSESDYKDSEEEESSTTEEEEEEEEPALDTEPKPEETTCNKPYDYSNKKQPVNTLRQICTYSVIVSVVVIVAAWVSLVLPFIQ